MDTSKTPETIDEYIKKAPQNVQPILKKIREIIRKAAPKAEETIKYRMPTFVLHGNLVHFAAMKNHIGFYPTPGPIRAFQKELASYETSKGAIRFPLDRPIPFVLITKMIKFRVKEHLAKAKKL